LVEHLKNFKVEKVSCGKNFTVAIAMTPEQQLIAQQKRESRIQTTHVYSWGRNDFGQLGHQQ
jgi:alpha-tubulin suppressor-like RCC1 family protein